MASCKTTAILAVFLAAAGAAIWLSGVAATNAACNSNEMSAVTRVQLFLASGFPVNASCAKTLGWSWLIVAWNIVAITVASAVLLNPKFSHLSLGALAMLVSSTVWLAPLANSFLLLMYNTPDEMYPVAGRAAAAAFSGALISCVADIILSFSLGVVGRCSGPGCGTTSAATCCRQAPAATTASVTTPDTIPVNAQAFITKRDAAAATMV